MAAAKNRPGKKKHSVTRWTQDEVDRLVRMVGEYPTMTEAFNVFGAETGRSAGTVRVKWYELKRKQEAGVGKGAASAASPVMAGGGLQRLSTDELVRLHHDTKEEIARRIAALTGVSDD